MAAHTRGPWFRCTARPDEALQRSAVLETQIQTAQTKVTELETQLRPLLQSLSKNGVRTLRAQREVRRCPGRWMNRKAGAIEEQAAFQRRVGKRTCSY